MRSYLCFLFLAYAVCICNVRAEIPKYSIDALGAGKYPNTVLNAHPCNMGIGVFTQKTLFKDPLPLLDKLLAKKCAPLVKLNLMWKSHRFSRKDFKFIIAEARRFVPLFEKYPDVECWFSGAVEHNLNRSQAAELALKVLSVIPNRCTYVNSPCVECRGALLPTGDRLINEIHGTNADRVRGRFAFSFDGSGIEAADVSAYLTKFRKAESLFLWSGRFNGHYVGYKRLDRQFRKGYPTRDYYKSIVALAGVKGTIKFPYAWFYRSHAGSPRAGDKAGERPIIGIPFKAPYVRIGKTICRSSGIQNKLFMYRCPKYGYQISTKPVTVRVGKRYIGTINPAFSTSFEN